MKTNCPDHVQGYAKSKWMQLIGIFEERGLMDDLKLVALEAYCVAYGDWRQARDVLNKKGLIVKDESGKIMPNPLVEIERTAANRIRAFGRDLNINALAEIGESDWSQSSPVEGRSRTMSGFFAIDDDDEKIEH